MPRVINLDFETYSEAGYVWNGETRKWGSLYGYRKRGLKAVGAAVYTRHPSTAILSAAYSIDGGDVRTWVPGLYQPDDLLDAVRSGAMVWAWNSFFEFGIWNFAARRLFDWPELPLEQTRDSAAVSMAFGCPGKLKETKKAFPLEHGGKMDEGKTLIDRYSKPRQPSKNDPRTRRLPLSNPEDMAALLAYNAQDVRVEAEVKSLCPPLSPFETQVWLADQRINNRGVALDVEAVKAMQALVDEYVERLNVELRRITSGELKSASQRDAFLKFLEVRGVVIPDLKADTIEKELEHGGTVTKLPQWARRMLEIRQLVSHASVKKLKAMLVQLCDDGRVRGLFKYCGARTWRWTGGGVQPQNMPRGHADVIKVDGVWMGERDDVEAEDSGWCLDASVQAIAHAKTLPGLDAFEARWGNVLDVISGCLRAMFIAPEGSELYCMDFSAIEAVVLAAVAEEHWRLKVFREGGCIYTASVSRITGTPVEEYQAYKAEHGKHHGDRSLGKVAELASGYGGGKGAWKMALKTYGFEGRFTDEEIETKKKEWRKASPNIVNFWYGVQRAAIGAVKNPGQRFDYKRITYHYDGRVLRCILPSGRAICYQQPSIHRVEKWGRMQDELRFWGYNTNPKMGKMGWIQFRTYGGKLTENIVQAISRDLLAHAMVNVEAAGYPVVLHVHDELAAEVRKGFGSLEEFGRIMARLPRWALGWLDGLVGVDGWQGREYRKD